MHLSGVQRAHFSVERGGVDGESLQDGPGEENLDEAKDAETGGWELFQPRRER